MGQGIASMRSQSCVISDSAHQRSHTVGGDHRFESPDQVHSFCAVVKGFARGLQFRGFGEAANWKQVFPLIFHFRSRKWQMSLSPRLRDGPGETVSSRSSPSPSSCSTSSAPSSTGLCAVALHTATLSGSGGRGTRGGKAVLCHACMHACVMIPGEHGITFSAWNAISIPDLTGLTFSAVLGRLCVLA